MMLEQLENISNIFQNPTSPPVAFHGDLIIPKNWDLMDQFLA